MNNFKIIAFTHKKTELKEIGKLYVDNNDWEKRLGALKAKLALNEIMYLATCNRVEFLLWNDDQINSDFLRKFFFEFNPNWSEKDIDWAIENASVMQGEEALRHFFYVASSIDSLVVGEREIITQVRNAFDLNREMGLSGDFIRLVVRKTIEIAKDVYTKTAIANNPVSVVSLAYRKLKELNISQDARFLFIGAGQTNSSMAKYLEKHKYKNFTVFNRSIVNAEKLAEELKGKAFPLTELANFREGFDVLITCTGSADLIITEDIYEKLVNGEQGKKIVIDLAIPNDFDVKIVDKYPVQLIEVSSLKSVAEENLTRRHQELHACHEIIESGIIEFRQMFKTRQVEKAMSEVPQKVREIKEMAIGTIYAKEIDSLDKQSREILDKVVAYMEKKYISMPMKMAKEILLDEKSKK